MSVASGRTAGSFHSLTLFCVMAVAFTGATSRADSGAASNRAVGNSGSAKELVAATAAALTADEVADAVPPRFRGAIFFRRGAKRFPRRYRRLLDDLASYLKDHPEVTRLELIGHSDNLGKTFTINNLARVRATEVAQYLQTQGIAAERVVVVGRGASEPRGSNKSAAGRSKNRRVELEFHVGQPALASAVTPVEPPEIIEEIPASEDDGEIDNTEEQTEGEKPDEQEATASDTDAIADADDADEEAGDEDEIEEKVDDAAIAPPDETAPVETPASEPPPETAEIEPQEIVEAAEPEGPVPWWLMARDAVLPALDLARQNPHWVSAGVAAVSTTLAVSYGLSALSGVADQGHMLKGGEQWHDSRRAISDDVAAADTSLVFSLIASGAAWWLWPDGGIGFSFDDLFKSISKPFNGSEPGDGEAALRLRLLPGFGHGTASLNLALAL